ncbi:hypothetical protein KKG45_05120 [bacterium]|nr:hypothetical protein [bacterium]MBU1072610.1 hypothetical protein [bacterium]MBU1675745.1 hypothetical protein [bacterium]
MYKINLYPEYRDNRKAARARTASTAILFSLLGLEVLMVGALLLSDSLLREQSGSLQTELQQLEQRLASESLDRPELRYALDLLEVRSSRIDWSPKFASLAENIGESLMLAELEGRAYTRQERASLVISGQYKDEQASLASVSGFLDRLRGDVRLKGDFPKITFGNIRSDGKGEFDLLCAPEEVPE